MATGTVTNKTVCYYGPSSTLYPSLDYETNTTSYVGPNESVTILWLENSWYYIQYNVGSTGKMKRMYIPKAAIPSYVGSLESSPVILKTVTSSSATVYTGPSTGYNKAGLIGSESVTVYNKVENGYTFIEYSAGSQKKRGYVISSAVGNSGGTGGMENYKTFKVGQRIPSGLPYAGASVNQGFNDTGTTNKGHLGYDMGGFTSIKPIFTGEVVQVYTGIDKPNGRVVTIKHTINGITFYSSYCHLKSIFISKGPVTTSTVIGEMGGSGYNSESGYPVHLHLCVYTGNPQTNPSGYCTDSPHNKTFEQVTSYANPWYYGPDTSKFPRCGGVCFYDPYGVITTNAQVINEHHA